MGAMTKKFLVHLRRLLVSSSCAVFDACRPGARLRLAVMRSRSMRHLEGPPLNVAFSGRCQKEQLRLCRCSLSVTHRPPSVFSETWWTGVLLTSKSCFVAAVALSSHPWLEVSTTFPLNVWM